MNDLQHLVSDLAAKLLKSFLIPYPSYEQTQIAESFINKVIIGGQFIISPKLTYQEQTCLFLAAKGMSLQETAKILKVSIASVRTYRKRINAKLKCKNMVQSVYEGIRYGYILPNTKCCSDDVKNKSQSAKKADELNYANR